MRLTRNGQGTIPRRSTENFGLLSATGAAFEESDGGVLIRPAASSAAQSGNPGSLQPSVISSCGTAVKH